MKKLRTVIVDDEPDSVALLQLQLEKNCPDIESVTAFTDPEKALVRLATDVPDILFLDVEMPILNGFELLEKLQPLKFQVIFVTAYNQYAIKALRFNAIDYLVKPVDVSELVSAVERAGNTPHPSPGQLNLVEKIMNGEIPKRIALSTRTSINFVELEEIVYVEASINYTVVTLLDGKKLTVSKTLKEISDVLETSHFCRVHRHFIVNLNEVRHYNKLNSMLTMSDNSTLPVARTLKGSLFQKYGWM